MTQAEPHDTRLKRLKMRSWRRGTKEMDLILGPFADSELASLDTDTLETYERMLAENDQDLYQWASGQIPAPEDFAALMARIVASRTSA